ncbi:amidase [Arthrobacter sp. YN]|uniref:amidase n=1 Tax=Arthrobacter sp. YN TaxID=2020486 RepID=UPI0012FE1437|nr:amidase [Arthrobacter sp. YN]
MNNELWRWSATKIVDAIRAKEISSAEVVAASLERLEQVEPVSNAFGEVAEDAVARAKEADAALARGESVGALHGVPVAFKMNTDVAGKPTADGVEEYLGMRAGETAPVVQNLLAAGAVELGRTNVPSFSLRWFTESEHWGRTLNPWDPKVTPGGSSGGAAVAVATGVVPIAHGNDLGGSLRYPGAVCGVVGLRPTIGRVPIWHAPPGTGMPLAFTEFVAEGAITRNVADARLALRVMERPDSRDPNHVASPGVPSARNPRRVALVTNPGQHPFACSGARETEAAVQLAGTWLAEAGYEVDEVELPLLGEAATLWWRLLFADLKELGFVQEIHRVREAMSSQVISHQLDVVEEALGELTLQNFMAAWSRRHLLRRQLSEFMDDHPLLVLPNSGELPFAYGRDLGTVDETREVMTNQWPNTSVPFFGLPAMGLGVIRGAGAPLGVQLVARAFDEEALFAGGEIIELRSGITTPVDPQTLG